MNRPKIFCFNNGGNPGWMLGAAIAEDGTKVASHISSHPGFMPHDLGITSGWQHEKYAAHYPDGYELVVDGARARTDLPEALDRITALESQLSSALGEQEAA